MLTLGFWVGLVLAFWFLHKARQLKARGEEGLAYHFFRDSLDFLIPFVSVLGLYTLAFAYVRQSESISLSTLIRIEEELERAKEFVAPFKLNHIAMFIVLFALYLAVMAGLSKWGRDKLHKGVKVYKNVVRLVYIVVLLLASFTFLGTLPGDPQLDIGLKIKTVREGYGALREEVASTLAEQAAAELCQKVYDSFPPWYGETFDLPPRLAVEAAALSSSYSRAAAEYAIKDRTIETAIGKHNEVLQATSTPQERTAPGRSKVNAPSDPRKPGPVPGSASLTSIEQGRGSLQRYRAGLKARMTTFLQRPGAKEVLLQVPKLLTGTAKNALIALSSDIPLMEPLIDTIVKTADDTLEKRFERAVDRAAKATVEGKPEAISQQASELVKQVRIVPAQEVQERAQATRANLESALAEVGEARVRLETAVQRAEARRIDTWIARLSSSNPDARGEATTRLVQSGDKLSKAQVDRLVRLMRHGSGSWTRFLYRESHCEWHEEVTVKHHAGEALATMRSPHVDSKLAQEARTASYDGVRKYRVTDPGWI